MRDLNEDADSSWSHHLHDYGHRIWQCNRNPGYDKEHIKRTMLTHNATFRKQVYELHRIYNRHKELMDELRKEEAYRYSESYASQTLFDASNKMWPNNVPVAANDEKTLTLSFVKDGDVKDANRKTHSRTTFDLRLPADVYIDCDEADKSGKKIVGESSSVSMFPLNSNHDNDVRLALGTSTSFSYRENSWNSDFCTQDGAGALSLADLNEPVTKNFERGASVSYNLRNSFEENPTDPSTSFRSKHNEEGTYPNVSYTYMDTNRGQPFFVNDAGETPSTTKFFGQDSSQVNFLKPTEAMQLNSSSSEQWQCSSDLKSQPMFGADTSAYQNSFRRIAFDKPYLNSRLDSNTTVIGDSKGKRIFGFSIFNDTRQNPAFTASSANCSGDDGTDQTPLEPPVAESSDRSFRNRMDLNSYPSSCEFDLEALAKEAAENIMRMSSTKHSHLDDVSCRPFDTLRWFAEVVSCEENSVKVRSDYELDMFEQSTLNLEETKPEEYSHRQSEQDDDKKNIAMSSLQPRRRQGRKRRQRRDFRKDILLGLSLLSMHEATEDIQTIAGRMKSMGQSWHATNSRARSRRPVVEPRKNPPQPTNTGMEVRVERGNIVGWERTTRRKRRQWYPPITNARTSIT